MLQDVAEGPGLAIRKAVLLDEHIPQVINLEVSCPVLSIVAIG